MIISRRKAIYALRLNEKDFRYIDKYETAKRIEEIQGIKTKQVKYYDEEEQVWKIGEVIIDETD